MSLKYRVQQFSFHKKKKTAKIEQLCQRSKGDNSQPKTVTEKFVLTAVLTPSTLATLSKVSEILYNVNDTNNISDRVVANIVSVFFFMNIHVQHIVACRESRNC